MIYFKTAVTPLLAHWSYCSIALSHQYVFMFPKNKSSMAWVDQINTVSQLSEVLHGLVFIPPTFTVITNMGIPVRHYTDNSVNYDTDKI